MVTRPTRSGKVSLRSLIIGAAVFVLLVAGGWGYRQFRRESLAKQGLADGRAAIQRKDWSTACKSLGLYLARYPNDVRVLKDYARAQLLVRPLGLENVGSALTAYRQVLRTDPKDVEVFDPLVRLYSDLGNFTEVIYIAEARLKQLPDDPKALVWLAKGQISHQKLGEGRSTLLRLLSRLDTRPDKLPEYVEACWLLGNIDRQSETAKTRSEAIGWLNRAIDHDPASAEAMVNRARFIRMIAPSDEAGLQAAMAAARKDLDRAEQAAPADPRVRLLITEEWIEHNQLDRAGAQLRILSSWPLDKIEPFFPSLDDWVIAKFLVSARWVIRRGTYPEGIALADEILALLKSKEQRVHVLPPAIELYVGANKVAVAERCLDEYLSTIAMGASGAPTNDLVPYLRGIVAQARGNPYEVINVVEPAAQRRPHPLFWRLLIEAYSQTGQSRRAVAAMKEYLRLKPSDLQMTMRLSRQYLRQGDYAKAFEAARLAEALDPTDVAVRLLRLGATLSAVGERGSTTTAATSRPGLQSVLSELAALRKAHPDRTEIRVILAAFAMEQGQAEQAERELKLAIQECKDTFSAELQLAQLYIRMNRRADAIEVARTACKRNSKMPTSWSFLAELLQEDQRYAEAQATLKSGIASVEDAWAKRDLSIARATLAMQAGNRADAIALLRDLASKDKQDIRAHSMLLSVSEVLRDTPTAQRLVDEIRLVQGETGLLWRLHQAALWLAGDEWRSRQKDVITLLERCIEGDPQWSSPALLLGQTYERLDNLSQAEAIYRRTLSANSSAVEIADRLTILLDKQRRFTESNQVLDQLRINPAILNTRRVRTAIGAGDLDRAIDELKDQIARQAKDVSSRILLARLVYRHKKDLALAMKYLDEAEAITPKSIDVLAARVSILKAEGRNAEARQRLDAEVKRSNAFEAHLLRAAYLAAMGDNSAAEKAYLELAPLGKNGQGYELLARFYLDTNRLNDAIVAWEKGLTASPDDTSIQRGLTRALLTRDQPADRQRGLVMLAALEKRFKEDPELLWIRAATLLKEGSGEATRKARAFLERVVQLEPRSIEAQLALIRILMEQGDYTAARDQAIRSLSANSNDARLMLARGKAERALKNWQMTREMANAVLADDPNSIEARELFAQAAIGSGDSRTIDGALTTMKDVADISSDDRIQIANAMLINAQGRTDEAIRRLEAYGQTDQGKRSVDTFLTLAELYRTKSDSAAWARQIDRAEALAPNSPAVATARTIWLASSRQFDKLERAIEDYRRRNPTDLRTVVVGATALASSGSKDHLLKAQELFEAVVAADPTQVDAQLGLGAVIYHRGDLDLAEKMYRKALELSPGNVRAMNDLAWVLADGKRDYRTALELVDKGVRMAPADANLRDTRAKILCQLPGRLSEAREEYARSVEYSAPNSRARVKALYRLGGVCRQLKDEVQARKSFQAAIEMDRKVGALTPEERADIAKTLGTAPEAKQG